MKAKDTYVCHLNTVVMFVGCKTACKKYKAESKHSSNWIIRDIEGYGEACYSEGSNDGYNRGVDEGDFFGDD